MSLQMASKLAEYGKPMSFLADGMQVVVQPAVIEAVNAARLTGHAVLFLDGIGSQGGFSEFHARLKRFLEKISVRKGELVVEELGVPIGNENEYVNFFNIYSVDHPSRAGKIPGEAKSQDS